MDQVTVIRLLARLGVTPMDIERVRQMPFPQSGAFLEELKARVKTNWKRLAFELHPDRTGNDPSKTEEFKALTVIRDDFDRLRVEPRPQMPRPVNIAQVAFIRVQRPPQYNVRPDTTSTSANSSHTIHFVVNMRPI